MRMNPLFRDIGGLFSLMVLCCILFGTAFSYADGADRLEPVALQLAWKHQFQFAGYYAALHKGFYEQAGLDVTIIEGGEGHFAREAVLSGEAQYGVTGAELLLHRAEGDLFVVLGAIFQHSASILLTRADAGISHPQDLIGKRVMLLPQNKDADILAIFQNEGISLDLIRRMDQTYNLDDLIQGRTDAVSAYVTNEPWLLQQAGVEPGIIYPQTYGVDFYSDCLFTTEEEIQKHPERVKRFLGASLEGWNYAMAHPEEIIDLLIERYGVLKSREHLRYEAQTMESLIFPKLVEMGHMNPGRWRHIANTFAGLGELPENFSLEGFLYDPNPQPDIRKLKFALYILLFGVILTSGLILLFMKMNRRLKKEVEEREISEKSLRESENRLRTIFEASQAGIILVDPGKRITFANQGTAHMLRCSMEALIGSAYSEHLHPDQREIGILNMERLIAGDIKAVSVERHFIRSDGTDFWGFLSGRRHEDEAGNLISLVGIIADITERKKLETELRQAHKMESIGTLTGGVAHDFNNILGIIIGNTELALDDTQAENPAHVYLEEIKTAGLRAAGIVRQLLNFSRKTEQKLKPVSAAEVLEEGIRLLRSTIPTTIEIRSTISDTEAVIMGDAIGIHQTLLNICTNALQEMEENGGVLEIGLETVNLDKAAVKRYPDLAPGDYAKITICDTGPGIRPDIIERIFDPYFTTKPVGKGTGMGLAVVHGIVKNHGGEITVSSPPGKGAVFSIFFPVVVKEAEKEPSAPAEIPWGGESILFVDDEPSITELVGKMLERLGYRVQTRENPQEALELFQNAPDRFDLVITDMTMPHMTGIQLYERLKAIREDIPVIICTGHSPLIDEKKAGELGIGALIIKPVVMREMARTIRSVLDRG